MSNRLRAATIEQMTKLGYRYEVRGPQQRVNFYLQVADRVDVRSTHVTGFRPREIDGRLRGRHAAHRCLSNGVDAPYGRLGLKT